jgi:flagellar biosynthesis protein FlhF
MNIQRFHAPTAREALTLARQTFGDGTLILSNRPVGNGVEVVATAEESLAQIARAPARSAAPATTAEKTAVGQDTEDMAMSTLSFQSYVRERMLRRRKEELGTASTPTPQPQAQAQRAPAPKPRVMHAGLLNTMPQATSAVAAERAATPHLAPPTVSIMSQGIVDELQNMKELIEERFSTLSWLGQARQDPIQSNLMLKLIRAGYSPSLARGVMERLPKSIDAAHAVRWVMDVLERNLKTDIGQAPLQEEGGIFALVGATGVGKTTTAAKLAALCVRTHGPNSVGLITLDTYRVAALEQLRGYGRMLGVVAHLAHDRAALQDLLNLLANKKMILIDTAGVAPHDPRKNEMVDDVLDLPHIKRLLVLNAGSHGDTLDDVLSAFKSDSAQQVILSKVDEAVKLGPALDAVIRHQVTLRGITNGQRVPEDWESADQGKLVRISMQTSGKSAFDPKPDDLNFFFSPAPLQHHYQGALHA